MAGTPSSATKKKRKKREEVYRGRPKVEIDGGWPEGWIQETLESVVSAGDDDDPSAVTKRQDNYWLSPKEKHKFGSRKGVKKFLGLLKECDGNENEAWSRMKEEKKKRRREDSISEETGPTKKKRRTESSSEETGPTKKKRRTEASSEETGPTKKKRRTEASSEETGPTKKKRRTESSSRADDKTKSKCKGPLAAFFVSVSTQRIPKLSS
jgi:hypothetical protein